MPLKFDLSKCTGCKLCQLACSAEHYGLFNPEKARLRMIHEYNEDGIRIASKSCILCRKCEKVCPYDAISFNGRWMIVDPEKCTGCGTCVRNCPTNIIFLENRISTICDLCGGEPECVKWCPKGVISLKERKEAKS